MSGFGADLRFAVRDAGFGAPSLIGGQSALGWPGFGGSLESQGASILADQPGTFDYPDDGGCIVRLYGAWLLPGPWLVRLTPDEGDTFYPLDQPGCYSGVIGKGAECYTDRFRRVLLFVLPVLPVGEYEVWIRRAGGTYQVAGVIKVVPRSKAEQTYSIRRTFPARFKTGARGWALEDGVLSSLPAGALETLTHALGQVMQQSGGSPQTRLLQPLSDGDEIAHVESTLGFPATGDLWIAHRRYRYAAIGTPPRFTGLALISSSDAVPLPALTEVTCAAAAIPG